MNSDQLKASAEKYAHPCKETCSGWKQGFDSGAELMRAELEKRAALIQESRDSGTMDASQEAAHYNWLDDQNEKLKSEISKRDAVIKVMRDLLIVLRRNLTGCEEGRWVEETIERVKRMEGE